MQRTQTYEHPGTSGTTVLGHLQVGDHLSLLEGGLPGGEFFDDLIQTIPTRSGRWELRLLVDEGRSPLAEALFGEPIDDPFTWVVAVHESHTGPLGPPTSILPEVGEICGKISLIEGTPTAEHRRAILQSSNAYVEVWNGGLTWLRPRCGLPTPLGGPEQAHTWIALIDTISE